MSTAEREKALDLALSQIDRRFGKGTIMRLGDVNFRTEEGVIPTGSLALDLALGIGGMPRGRIIEVFGSEASGKTTLCLHIAAEAQKAGGTAAYIDVEHALDPAYAQRLGVNIEDLLIAQPDYAEQALDVVDYLIRSGAVDVVVVDSVAALVPKTELEGDMGDIPMGLQARLMSQALRKLTSSISRSNTVLIFINQLREKIGVVFGNPETTPGGRALKFYASVRVDLRRTEAIKVGTETIGNRVRARVVKNKVAAPFRVAEFDILFNQGFSREGDLVDLGVDQGLVKKSGAFYSYGETRMGQGREHAKEFLRQHQDIAGELERKIREAARAPLGFTQDSPPDQQGEEAAPVAVNGAKPDQDA